MPAPLLLLPLLYTAWGAASCALYSCTASLPANMCINRLNSYSFEINSNGCDVGYQCSITDVVDWQDEATENTMACSPQTTPTSQASSPPSPACPPFQLQKGFLSGSSFLSCQHDPDCVLQDGSHTSCLCVFRSDGLGVCLADVSNTAVFQQYWIDCGPEGKVKDQETALYWDLERKWWPWTQSNLLCNNVFSEMALLQDAATAYDCCVRLSAVVCAAYLLAT